MNTIWIRATLLPSMLVATIGCSTGHDEARADVGAKSEPSVVINKSEVAELRKQYLSFYMPMDGKKVLPPALQPQNLLPKLHNWFRIGRGLSKPIQMGQDYKVYELSPLPTSVLNEIRSVTMESGTRFSWALITADFWNQVATLQKEGFRIAVLSSDNPVSVSGVYFDQARMIAFDVFSEPGTLIHEKRHADQAAAIKIFSSQRQSYLSKTCIHDVSRALGEIDATQFEIWTYKGLSEEINVDPSDTLAFGLEKDPIAYPQANLLLINMGYPTLAAGWVGQSSDCPAEIHNAMKAIANVTSRASSRISGPINVLVIMRHDNYMDLLDLKKNDCDRSSSDICEQIKTDLTERNKRAIDLQSEFETNLADEIQNRPIVLNYILSGLSINSKNDLCRFAMGFSQLVNCDGVARK